MPQVIWFAMILLVLVKLWLVGGQALTVRLYAHDDYLFIKLAGYLLSGDWLGPYDELTLAKGCFYPLWIAASFVLGLPLLLSQHLLYVTACFVAMLAFRPVLKNPLYQFIFFVFLLFNPISYTDQAMTRVLRDGIYPALTLITISCAVGLYLRPQVSWQRLWGWSIGLGGSLAAFWLTREEGVWILPVLAMIVGFDSFQLWRTKSVEWKTRTSLWAGSLTVFLLCVGIVAAINWFSYGVFAKTEFDSSQFKAAYGALSRVKPLEWVPKVAVTKQTRMQIYEVSPTFNELKPYLEGEIGQAWTVPSKAVNSQGEKEIDAAFIWVFRQAVAAAGYYADEKFPGGYYQRVADEVNLACDQGKLDCFSPRATLQPLWRAEYLRPLVKRVIRSTSYLAAFQEFTAKPSKSLGAEESVRPFRDLTREQISEDDYLKDASDAPNNLPTQSALNDRKISLLNGIGRVYQVINPYLAAFSMLGFALITLQICNKRFSLEAWLALTVVLTGVVMRVLLIAWIDTTSFPAIRTWYLAPAYPLMLILEALSLYWSVPVVLAVFARHLHRSDRGPILNRNEDS
jgi:hypothetical protein